MDVWGGIRQWAKWRKKETVEGEGGVIGRATLGWKRKAVTNHCRLRGGKGIGRWWENRVGRADGAVCPRCEEEEETSDHIVFQCR